MLTLEAVGRVGELGHPGLVDGRVHAVVDHRVGAPLAQGAGEGIVGIEAEHGMFTVADADADVVQGVAHLAVAIQLIAEDVGHRHHLGVYILADGLEGRLIGFDEGIVVLALAGEARVHGKLRGDAAEEIRAGLVGKVRDSSVGQHLLDHSRGGGLSVGARDDHRRHVLCQHAQHVRTELQGHAAREVCPASAQQPNQPAGEFAGENGNGSS